MDFVLRPCGDGEWRRRRRRRRSVCPIKANLYCCQPGEARIGGGLLLPSSFLVMPCSKKKEERDFPFQEWQKSRSPLSCSFYSLFGDPSSSPPKKKRTNTQQASLLGQAFAHICPCSLRVSPLPRQTVVEILLSPKKKNQASNPLPSVHSSHPFFSFMFSPYMVVVLCSGVGP